MQPSSSCNRETACRNVHAGVFWVADGSPTFHACSLPAGCGMQDVQDVLQQHGAVLDQLPAHFQPHELLTTATNLLRVLKVTQLLLPS